MTSFLNFGRHARKKVVLLCITGRQIRYLRRLYGFFYMLSLSLVVITYNEEKNLERCLASAAGLVSEIIVVDSNSTDRTKEVAEKYGARVADRRFDGYAQQKNFATSLAANDWILSLDADEQLTPELADSIRAVLAAPQHDVYKMARLTSYCGKWIRHCGWYPDYQVRLYNRTKGRWQELKVHEYWKLTDENGGIGLLRGDLLHYSFTSIEQHKRKIDRYTDLAAEAAMEKGKRGNLLKVIFSPVWHFISEYFFRLGFLDGYYGWVICRLSARSAYLKYSKIRRLAAKK